MSRPVLCLLPLVCLLSAACSETRIQAGVDPDDILDSDDPTGGVKLDGEWCDGLDNDGDGQVDEGFPDSDGDGWADCMERDCDVEVAEGGEIPIDPACVQDPWFPPDRPWDVRVEWHVPTSGTGVVIAPAVGNLTDDNGDGFVDDRDVPEIAFSVHTANELMVLDGATGEVLWHYGADLPPPWDMAAQGTAGVIIADVDSDGDNEVVAMASHSAGFVITAFEADGRIAWATPAPWYMTIYAMATVADLDANGTAEVIFDRMVLDGRTGAVLADLDVFEPVDPPALRTPVVGDVDQDGQKEILLGPDRFELGTPGPRNRGQREYRHPRAQRRSVHNAIADVDGDAEGEIITLYSSVMEIADPDGTVLYRVQLPGDNGGPPCVADFDGDDVVEIGIGVGENVAVYELDGTEMWTHRSVDATIAHAGCSGYDFDGDGAYELLHADQHDFYIFDGATGEVRHREPRHTSTTHFEYPVVADVDNDGAAEIVLGSNTNDERPGWGGITVLGHSGSGWARSGATWGVHDFAVTNLGGDGSVPANPVPPWLAFNVFRARPTVDTPALPNLQVEITDACVGTCEGGPLKVSWTARNLGGAPVRPGTRVTLYRFERFERQPIDSRLLGAIPPGTELPGDIFVLDPDDLGDGLLLEVDDDGRGRGWVDECHEDDNRAALEAEFCDP